MAQNTRRGLMPARFGRIPCDKQIYGVGKGIIAHAYSNKPTKFPDSLDEVIEGNFVVRKQLRCPQSNSEQPAYYYVPGATADSPDDRILLIEAPHYHNGSGHVFFFDGRVELLPPDKLIAVIEKYKVVIDDEKG